MVRSDAEGCGQGDRILIAVDSTISLSPLADLLSVVLHHDRRRFDFSLGQRKRGSRRREKRDEREEERGKEEDHNDVRKTEELKEIRLGKGHV